MAKIKPIYMSCEVQRRELNSRLFLAMLAAARGYTSVITQKVIMRANLPRVPTGVFWHKTATVKCAHYFDLAKQHHHRTVACCEEIINVPDDPVGADYARIYFDDGAAKNTDLYLAATVLDSRMARQHPFGRVLDVGNTRIELLRGRNREIFADPVNELHQKFGNFILINSPFGLAGSLRSIQHERKEYEAFAAKTESFADEYFKERFEREKQGIGTIVELARTLSDQGKTVLVRPHPHENPDTWKELLRDIPHTAVDDSGAVGPVLIACDALLQGNCTTGLEAILLDKPVGNFMSAPDQMLSARLIPALGPENALEQIREPISGLLDAVRQSLHGIDQPITSQIIDAFDELDPPECELTDLLTTKFLTTSHFGDDKSMERRWPLLDYRSCKLFVRGAAKALGIGDVGLVNVGPNIIIIAPAAAMHELQRTAPAA
ncbi:surface carbohydrate biosynthesis protein [Ferrovibrio sp.]|uniref:surface carbohydrate biosynthesis protein n=1 Tax=Ferrovibrio sp. TaxID=1917215 RepID=UPI00260328DA|nr:surface carbohydrate biosynthesis protein [Ferrovibrio sp.]